MFWEDKDTSVAEHDEQEQEQQRDPQNGLCTGRGLDFILSTEGSSEGIQRKCLKANCQD